MSYAIETQFIDEIILHNLLKKTNTLLEKQILNSSNFDFFCQSFSKGQIASKNWLVSVVNSLNLNLGTIYLCAGWYATLALHKNIKFTKFRNIDLSIESINIATELHKNLIIDDWKYLSIHKNITDINYIHHEYVTTKSNGEKQTIIECPDTIINTSCEHIAEFTKWFQSVPQGKLIILQSNNGFEIPDHINAVKNLNEFEIQTPMEKVLYSSELKLPKFTRYMRIGYK